jgi:hypothetical protein
MLLHEADTDFESRLQGEDLDGLLCAFLQLIDTLQVDLHQHAVDLTALFVEDQNDLIREVIETLKHSDILRYTCCHSLDQVQQLRLLLASSAGATNTQIIDWFRKNWGADVTTADIITGVASSVRSALTTKYGLVELLSRYSPLNQEREGHYQEIRASLDRVRQRRDQFRLWLIARSIEIQPY